MNLILRNEPYYIAMKIEFKMNLVLVNEPCIRWENRWQSKFGNKKMNLVRDNKKELDSRPSPLGWIIIYYLLFLVNLLL